MCTNDVTKQNGSLQDEMDPNLSERATNERQDKVLETGQSDEEKLASSSGCGQGPSVCGSLAAK